MFSFESIKLAVIGSIIVGLALFGGWEAYTKSRLQTEVAKQQDEIDQYKDANVSWKQQTDASNKAMAALVAQGKARDAAAVTALAASQKQAKTYSDEAFKLMKQKATGDDCAATKTFLSNYFSTAR